MDDQAVIRTYGNTNLPEGTEDRPLVTFALFAYNQEHYIREAVEAALTQTYEPLEIILSDDCSTDRTFEIMQERAAAYDGPHRVIATRTKTNLGVLRHVLQRGREAQGQIVVIAAGDDISDPLRVERHLTVYNSAEVLAVTSAFRLIDSSGRMLSDCVEKPINLLGQTKRTGYFKNTRYPYQVIQGSTASYRADLFDIEIPTDDLDASEDNWFNFLVYLLGGRVAFVPEVLVAYRMHSGALTNTGARKKSYDETTEVKNLARGVAELSKLRAFRSLEGKCAKGVQIDFESIIRREHVLREVQSWKNRSALQRVGSSLLEALRGEATLAKWKALRIFGSFPKYQPRLALEFLLKSSENTVAETPDLTSSNE